jgi:hypothetical protein
MIHPSRAFAISLIPLLLFGCKKQETPVSDAVKTFRYTIPPGTSTRISISILPMAVCTLTQSPRQHDSGTVRFVSDGNGNAQFFVLETGEKTRDYLITCNSGNASRSYELSLRADSHPTDEMPAPQEAPTPTVDHVRPALSEHDLTTLSNNQLRQRGYPPRPNPQVFPNEYAMWREWVSREAEIIRPQIVELAGETRRPYLQLKSLSPAPPGGKTSQGTSLNWSGFALMGGWTAPYDMIAGHWSIPQVDQVQSMGHTALMSSTWIGLDGSTANDRVLAQGGTEQDASWMVWDNGDISKFSIYQTWSELLPNQPTEHVISNAPTSPGDAVETLCSINKDDHGNQVSFSFYIKNVSEHNFEWDVETPLSGTVIPGNSAEWVMERPTVNGSISFLAQYQTFQMENAKGVSHKYGGPMFVPYSQDENMQITMINDSNQTLSTVTENPSDAAAMVFTWQAPKR